jgi:hypothetical protein
VFRLWFAHNPVIFVADGKIAEVRLSIIEQLRNFETLDISLLNKAIITPNCRKCSQDSRMWRKETIMWHFIEFLARD